MRYVNNAMISLSGVPYKSLFGLVNTQSPARSTGDLTFGVLHRASLSLRQRANMVVVH